jgi:type II secretory pathway pseudopilin PulG
MVGVPQPLCSGGIARAFSLAELVVVGLIIAIFAAIVAPRFARSIARHRVEMTARRIAADLALVRQRAATSSASQEIRFYPSSDSYVLTGLQHLDHSGNAYKVDLSTEPYVARLVSAEFGGDARVVFDIYGMPDTDGQVLVAVGNWQKTIKLNAETGKATVN